MSKKKKLTFIIVWLVLIVAVIIAAIAVGAKPRHETIKELMKDAVLHEQNKISFFNMQVNPGLISAFVVTAILLVFAAFVRIFAIPRFKNIPGKFQLLLEQAVGFFENMAKQNSSHNMGFIAFYIFCAGAYVFVGTLFELLGVQAVTAHGTSITLPAPLSDINGAIAMGSSTFLMLVISGIVTNGLKGLGSALKEFSLPISMSFRLFGALLSGLLVTELVYYYVGLSFALPVVVGVLFTLIHAIIQTYVLTMLASVFYGEITEKHAKKVKSKK